MNVARMRRPTDGGRVARSGGGGAGGPRKRRGVLGGVGRAVLGAPGELVRGRAAGAGDQRAHLVEAGVEHVLGGGDAAAAGDPPASREGGAPHEARGPDVAVDAALVAEAVGEAGLAEQFVELAPGARREPGRGPRRCGHRRPRRPGLLRKRRCGWPEKRVRQLERRGLGDVEAIDEPVADQVEIAGDRRACFAAERAQAREHLRGVAVGFEELAGSGSLANASFRRSISSEPPADTSAEPRIRPSSSDGGRPVQSPTWARKSPVGSTAPAVKRMCWAIIAEWWSRQRVR